MRSKSKFRGCLLGGAVGDALGYQVEFLSYDEIIKNFGSTGICNYAADQEEVQFSDDTQMTLFTANALLYGTTRAKMKGIKADYVDYLGVFYQDWLLTQKRDISEVLYKNSWLLNYSELYSCRAPGLTCLAALEEKVLGTLDEPINNSKGCGGIMRVAPIGLYFEPDSEARSSIALLAAKAAALTHGHELGYIPAAALSVMINRIVYDNDKNFDFKKIVADSLEDVAEIFGKKAHWMSFVSLIEKAQRLAEENLDDILAIEMLGEGWVAEETLAIAVYSCLKYSDSFEKAVIVAVNHGGDSDSTGAVTGNLMGAYLGVEAIPDSFLNRLELCEVIIELADDLCQDCPFSGDEENHDELWVKKYVEGDS